ncbi:hypothetical protein BKA65DRAFT_414172, partial [Rhexocercosporidium sp. MPI-PUGE-AT-0058]
VVDAFMAFMVLWKCCQIEGGLPLDVQLKMWINILLDFVVGLTPFVGDIIDVLPAQTNTNNAILLEKHLRQKGAKALEAQGRQTPAIGPSDPGTYDRILRKGGEGRPPRHWPSESQRVSSTFGYNVPPHHSDHPPNSAHLAKLTATYQLE